MKTRVLVVDDEPDALELIEYNLNGAGYQVFTAANGTKALEMARRHQPDVIVLDLMLPGLMASRFARFFVAILKLLKFLF